MVLFNETDQKKKLSSFRKKEEEHLARQKASQSDYTYVDLTGISINTDALQLIPEQKSRETEMVVFGQVDKKLQIAAREPDKDAAQSLIYQLKKKGWQTEVYVTSPSSLEKAYGYYADISSTEQSEAGEVSIADDDASAFLAENPNRKDAIAFIKQTLESESDTTQIIESLVAAAIAMKASDIHIEAGENNVSLRMRIDGVLQEVTPISEKTYKLLLSRIKLLSGMKLNINREAQDGRFSIKVHGNDTEIRTSVIPSSYAEGVVMRVLSKASLDTKLEALGMRPRFLRIIRHEINRPKGLILNTGPTGSGKTTTLYSFLKEMNQPDVKAITIENPVEYHLEGVVQTQVDPDDGYNFYDGLKAAMRQDPDIVMIGEIRDSDTAKTAIQASLTGHRVLSTLHTNDAVGTFPRLVELGIKENLIGSGVNVVMAQRLIRKLCDTCKKKIPIEGEDKEIIQAFSKSIPDPDLYEDSLSRDYMYTSVGCEECNDTGYRGRIGVFEAVVMDEEIAALVQNNPSDSRIKEHMQREQKMLTMAQDGILKVLEGTSDMDELKRVIDIEEVTRKLIM